MRLALTPIVALAFVVTAMPFHARAQERVPPSVTLPAALDRVLKDYERGWGAGDATAVAALFATDGFALPDGKPAARGREAITRAYTGNKGPLVLRAVAWATSDSVGYIVGAYGYGERTAPDMGKFLLALRRDGTGRWLIAADMDNGLPQPPK